MKKNVFYLNQEQTKKIIEINKLTKKYVIPCDYGTGTCISSEIKDSSSFIPHMEYITGQGLIESEIDVPLEDYE